MYTIQSWIQMGRAHSEFLLGATALRNRFSDYHDGIHAITGLTVSMEDELCVLEWQNGFMGLMAPSNPIHYEWWLKGQEWRMEAEFHSPELVEALVIEWSL